MTTALAERRRRREKLELLRARGVDPFPDIAATDTRTLVASALAQARPGEHNPTVHRLAGRIVARRSRGPVAFFELRDRTGAIRVRAPNGPSAGAAGTEGQNGASAHGAVTDFREWDIGDIVAVSGTVRSPRGGEVGLEASSGTMLAKAQQVNHGLRQLAHRTRRRELALMERGECHELFLARARLVAAIRAWLVERDFVEVETPVLQPPLGGGLARPFLTHCNALDRDAALRSASQLYLRRCIVGDLERVFELGRCFRNEGISARHHPEFTMLEWSLSYSDYLDSATHIEQLVRHLATHVTGTQRASARGAVIDLRAPWRRISLREAIKERTGLDIRASAEELAARAGARGSAPLSWSQAVHSLYATEVEPHIEQPTIVHDFPLDTHPCAKRHPADGRLAQCFDIVIGGLEIASGGTELSDPDEQTRRFCEHAGMTPRRWSREHPLEREYVAALRYGAPPSSGVGVGVDRLLMALLGVGAIGDVTLFSPLA